MVLVHKNIKWDTNITKPTPCELLTLQQVWLNGRLFTLWERTCALIINQNMYHKTEPLFRHPSIHGWIDDGLHDSLGHGGSSLSRDGHTSLAAATFSSFSSCSDSTIDSFPSNQEALSLQHVPGHAWGFLYVGYAKTPHLPGVQEASW